MRILFLGPPGVGKGTQAQRVCARRRIAHISTGDILREAIRKGSPTGLKAKGYMDRGELVPDQVMIELIKERLQHPDARRGFLLDGFPRTTEQARALDLMLRAMELKLDGTYALLCSRERIVERLSGRRTCRKCGATFHLTYVPPRTGGRCDSCGGELYQREDDRPEAILQRLEVYEHQTAPLIHYYRQNGLLREVSAEGDPETVAREIELRIPRTAAPARASKRRAQRPRRAAKPRRPRRKGRRRPARAARRKPRRPRR